MFGSFSEILPAFQKCKNWENQYLLKQGLFNIWQFDITFDMNFLPVFQELKYAITMLRYTFKRICKTFVTTHSFLQLIAISSASKLTDSEQFWFLCSYVYRNNTWLYNSPMGEFMTVGGPILVAIGLIVFLILGIIVCYKVAHLRHSSVLILPQSSPSLSAMMLSQSQRRRQHQQQPAADPSEWWAIIFLFIL